MNINSLESLGTQTGSGIATSLSTQYQRNFQKYLQQLEQDATSNPQAALQLLRSVPSAERHALMKALREQDPQAAASIHAAFQQQELQQQTSSVTALNHPNISMMIQLAQNVGKMIGSSSNQQPKTGPSDGYSAFTSMKA